MSVTVTMEETNQNRQANIKTVQIDWYKAYLPDIAPSQPKACLLHIAHDDRTYQVSLEGTSNMLCRIYFLPIFCAHVCCFDINCFYQCVVGHSKCTCNPSLSTKPSQHLSAPLTQDSSRIYGFPQTGNRFLRKGAWVTGKCLMTVSCIKYMLV